MNSPEISVVIAARGSSAEVSRCLDSLRRQSCAELAEQIVVDCSTDGTATVIMEKYPQARVVHSDKPRELPELIRDGLRQAQGRVIVVTDTCCTFPSDWLQKLSRAHEEDYEVIGGAVENARKTSLVAWACYFSDYGAFMLPSERRATHVLAGNHVSYKRQAIESALDSMENGFWKIFVHKDLLQHGARFLLNPELVAYYSCGDTFWSFLRRYYRHATLFAEQCCQRISLLGRYLRILGTPLLPGVLFFRRLRAGITKKEHRAEFLKALPLIAVLVTAWAAGELTGYLRGYPQPHSACRQ